LNVTLNECVSELLVPVTTTTGVPEVVNVHCRLKVPEVVVDVRVTEGAVRRQLDPPFWERLTVPVNPFTAVTVTIELACMLTVAEIGV